MKRRGIVLMMTLILISVLMGIVALVLTQSTRLSNVSENAFLQSASMRVVNDLQRQLPSLLSGVRGAEQLDLALRLPLQIETQKGDFVLKASLASPYGRLNINRLASPDGNISEQNTMVLMRLFAVHPIADPDMLLKLVFDTIDTNSEERAPDTEIAATRTDFKDGFIADSKQFNILLERYVELTKDTSVLSIDWDDYIGYEGEKMDFNAVNPETLSLILPTVSPERIRALTLYRTKAFSSKEEAIAAEPALGALFDTYFFIYKPGTSYNLLCDVRLQENSREEHLKFQYNLLDKKVRRVEFL